MNCYKNINIEVLRFFCILGVILIHMSMGYYYNKDLMISNHVSWFFENIYYSISRFCVPVFFIISAYLCFNSKSSKNWRYRFLRLFIPYFTWSMIYYIYSNGIHYDNSIIDFLKKIFTSTTSFHLWFIPTFIGYSMLLPAIKKLLHDDGVREFRHIVLFFILMSVLLPSLIFALNVFFGGGYDFLNGLKQFYLTIPSLLIYGFLFPYIYKQVSPVFSLLIYLVLLIANIIINFVVSFKLGTPNEFYYGYATPIVLVSSFLFFNIFMSIDMSRINQRLSRFILIVGECSFGIYLSHWLVFNVLYKYGFIVVDRAIVGPLINTLIVFFVSFGLVFCARNVRHLKIFL